MILDGHAMVNIGRYINSGFSTIDSNCSVSTFTGLSGIWVLIHTRKKVKKQTELTYFYGKNYWLQDNKEKNK